MIAARLVLSAASLLNSLDCGRFAAAPDAGTVADAAVVELSGLAASHAHPGVFWGLNDSGGKPELYAIGSDGKDLGTYAVPGATNVDWEDLAVGPGPAIYVGDIGDNEGKRTDITVYRVAEPGAPPTGPGRRTLASTERFHLTYPGGPQDAESLLVDPVSGDLFVLTKSVLGETDVLEAPASALVPGADIMLTKAASFQSEPFEPGGILADRSKLPATMVTAADVSPDGSLVLVRTYQNVIAFARPAGQPLGAAFTGERCEAPQTAEKQGESIAFTATGDGYVTASEGAKPVLHRFSVAAAPDPPSTTTTVRPTTTSVAPTAPATTAAPAPATGTSGSGTVVAVFVGGIVILGLVAGLRSLMRARRAR